ncbi:hypothetical protein Ctha_1593 [Chloroherpeton thalassium ATCC 35110]|uniref:Glycosyltransferase RgtA/B/C/D-like domain-containing protein n=1 Tax=Chloroherpeton thalassium (strain ATCC 35110 / GB-78) TaxID=517418 RepID=B3QSK4_CHLT3|nr:hypothetical protein [Chloroherpeton thalassium]ACF14051.1 hypothetical protein Ctha_1593 [Chloroherpeton thalassium ATCC 35110]
MFQNQHHFYYLLFSILILLFIASSSDIGMNDYFFWVSEGFILNEYWLHGAFHNTYTINPYFPPNAFSQIFIALMSVIIHPFQAAQLLILIAVLLVFSGIYFYMKLSSPQQSRTNAAVAFAFTLNYTFFMGNMNYYFGFGVAFLAYYIIRKNDLLNKSPLKILNVFILSILFLISYASHFFSIAILGLLLVIHVFRQKSYRALIPMGIAALPVTIFLRIM